MHFYNKNRPLLQLRLEEIGLKEIWKAIKQKQPNSIMNLVVFVS